MAIFPSEAKYEIAVLMQANDLDTIPLYMTTLSLQKCLLNIMWWGTEYKKISSTQTYHKSSEIETQNSSILTKYQVLNSEYTILLT